ncbi:hypothetical protein AB06_4039 [Escherichia coli 2-474-04_S1_C1]|nr:hypothetical protein AB06_4039 [Escherichia coli 2-474-04_S1_C1]
MSVMFGVFWAIKNPQKAGLLWCDEVSNQLQTTRKFFR